MGIGGLAHSKPQGTPWRGAPTGWTSSRGHADFKTHPHTRWPQHGIPKPAAPCLRCPDPEWFPCILRAKSLPSAPRRSNFYSRSHRNARSRIPDCRAQSLPTPCFSSAPSRPPSPSLILSTPRKFFFLLFYRHSWDQASRALISRGLGPSAPFSAPGNGHLRVDVPEDALRTSAE